MKYIVEMLVTLPDDMSDSEVDEAISDLAILSSDSNIETEIVNYHKSL